MVLTAYIAAAMERATYKILDDDTYFGEVSGLQGMWANGSTLEECRRVLQEVLEEWLLLKLADGDEIPEMGGITLGRKTSGHMTLDSNPLALFVRQAADDLQRALREAPTRQHRSGEYLEDALMSALRRCLPTRYGASRGWVINAAKDYRKAREQDLVVYDRTFSPFTEAQEERKLFFCETVVAIVEVKATLNAKELHDAAKTISYVKGLRPTYSGRRSLFSSPSAPASQEILGCLFAYKTAFKDRMHFENCLEKAQSSVGDSKGIDLLCSLKDGWFGIRARRHPSKGILPAYFADSTPDSIPLRFELFQFDGSAVHSSLELFLLMFLDHVIQVRPEAPDLPTYLGADRWAQLLPVQEENPWE